MKKVIELLTDQLVRRNVTEDGQRVDEYDVWYQGAYLGTIEKHGLIYHTDILVDLPGHMSLQAALLEYEQLALESNGLEAVVFVPEELPEHTIINFFKGTK
ncbi:hypothetical protein MYO4S_00095 [Serratia phage 4S]|nr:hypothetical protein MYO4S_00095 [Serratia phage 4S]